MSYLDTKNSIRGPVTVQKRGKALALVDGSGRAIWSIEQTSVSMIASSDYTSKVLTISKPPALALGDAAYLGEQITLSRTAEFQIDWAGAGRNFGHVAFDATGKATLYSQIVVDNFGKNPWANSPVYMAERHGRARDFVSLACICAIAAVTLASLALGAAIAQAGAQAGVDPLSDAIVVAAAIGYSDAVADEHASC